LELLGDAILGGVVSTYLFTRYADEETEGFITKTKSKLVRKKTLAKLGSRLRLGKWVLMSLHVESEGGRKNKRIMEDTFESFIGAIFLDNGGEPIDDNWFPKLA